VGVHQGNHITTVIRALSIDINPVRIECAGAVELLTADPPSPLIGRNLSVDFTQLHRADLAPAAAHQLTVHKAAEPATPILTGWLVQAILNKCEVRTQRLWQVRICLSQFGQQSK
jgi:hypothetical protein